ncbi:MAG TPA: hypothetical protein VHY91_16310 [Pirellulales bacterium]|nr:hypothetical protein [Pirellulales bacterium]
MKQVFSEVVNVLAQQAVFTSGRCRQREGFHLISRSGGLTKADAQLLVRRLPWCDALSTIDPSPTGTSYCELADDSICISRTIRLSGGPIARGLGPDETAQLLTHCLVVPREVFERFANNPFAILRAVSASGFVVSHEPVAARLQPVRLSGRAPEVDRILLANLARHPGPAVLAGLVHEARERMRLIVVGSRSEELLAGLISVLPVNERPDFSFSVGLRPSLRRPVRIVAVPESNLQLERFARQCRYHVLKLSELGKVEYGDDAWAMQVEEALEEGNFSWLAEQVTAPRVAGIGEGTAAAGRRAERPGSVRGASRSGTAATARGSAPAATSSAASLAVLDQLAGGRSHETVHDDAVSDCIGHIESNYAAPACAASSCGTATAVQSRQSQAERQDAAADATSGTIARRATDAARAASQERERTRPRHDTAAHDPASLAMLEQLDDLVYDAIAGRPGAFEELTRFWPQAQTELEGESLVESREQYVRYALGLWGQGEAGGILDPQRAMGALDVLCLLFPEGEF